MNFTNINDPAGVKALLDQLRSSQAWQELASAPSQPGPSGAVTSTSSAKPFNPPPSESAESRQNLEKSKSSLSDNNVTPDPPGPSSSVAALLSQLHAHPSPPIPSPLPSHGLPLVQPHHFVPPAAPYLPPEPRPPTTTPSGPSPSVRKEDLRGCTFQQALPHLVRLSEDPTFLKKEQADLERQLWDERKAIQRKHEEKIKVARNKASLIGVGLTQFEADMMSDAFRKELRKFDAERVLPAWDGLITKQQAKLESLSVPAMYQTTMSADRERQQRVMQVLNGIVGNEGS
ncbi:uncharacterized protein FIBRA_06192 [Fibroporia radiculosa]|uniref:Uncharacterized protein n=1 Tax=Fibroporia radiculosa TaxID=599839 RepID=J4GSB6_9APHY|nr:uncharacterized protein FIBRA_06192 [Fibroporia radiculosa]CCM04035.1 predicted protein [Fibroporia radiculosa]